MKLPVKEGATYRTRDGSVVGPMKAIPKDNGYEFEGTIIEDASGEFCPGEVHTFTRKGKFVVGDRRANALDLIIQVKKARKVPDGVWDSDGAKALVGEGRPIVDYPTAEEIDAKDLLGVRENKIKNLDPSDFDSDTDYGSLADMGSPEAQDALVATCKTLNINTEIFQSWCEVFEYLRALKHPSDSPPEPLSVKIEATHGDLVISRKVVAYIERCLEEIMRPTMNTVAMHNKAQMYEEIVKRSGDMAVCAARALSEAHLTPSPEPGYGVESEDTKALRLECNRVALINRSMRQAFHSTLPRQTT